MKIKDHKIKTIGNRSRVEFIFNDDIEDHELFFELPTKHLNKEQIGSASFLSVFLPACAQGGFLEMSEKNISEKLEKNIWTIFSMMKKWFPYRFNKNILTKTLPKRNLTRIRKNKKACFFTGGIDSTYTYLKHKAESGFDSIVFVHKDSVIKNGKQIFLKSTGIQNVRAFAKKFNMELIEVNTNIRDFAKHRVDYTAQYHGSLFASIAILLSEQIGTFYFGSSHSYSSLTPYGSHPALDYLFSVEDMEFVHDGAEATRVEKVEAIAKHPESFPYLHYDCGQEKCSRSGKCIRTMINLDIVGIRQQCPWANKHGYTLDEVRNIGIAGFSDYSKAVENYNALAGHADKKELRQAIKESIIKFAKKRNYFLPFKI